MSSSTATVQVWDPLVRVGHWVLAAAFCVAYLTEGEPIFIHSWAGYIVAALVAVRVIWGFVGSRRARFGDFVRGPGAALRYAADLLRRRSPRFLGHSPAGGAMVVALLLCLGATAFTGMALLAEEKGQGPLAAWFGPAAASADGPADTVLTDSDQDDDGERAAGGERESRFEEIHEVLANVTLGLVILHVLGVVWASLAHRENLVRAMVTGRKRAAPAADSA